MFFTPLASPMVTANKNINAEYVSYVESMAFSKVFRLFSIMIFFFFLSVHIMHFL